MGFARHRKGALIWIGVLVLFCIFAVGCSTLEKKNIDRTASSSDPKPDKKEDKNKPLYYEFSDVLIPAQLTPIQDSSFVYQTAGLSAGVMTFKGRVEMSSLVTFFERNMRKDNWRRVSVFKSPRTILLFQKDNRWCVIHITAGYKTDVTIWVAPTLADPGN